MPHPRLPASRPAVSGYGSSEASARGAPALGGGAPTWGGGSWEQSHQRLPRAPRVAEPQVNARLITADRIVDAYVFDREFTGPQQETCSLLREATDILLKGAGRPGANGVRADFGGFPCKDMGGGSPSFAPASEKGPGAAPHLYGEELDGFRILLNRDAAPGMEAAFFMGAVDLASCKKVCREHGYGAFVVYKGQAFFRREAAGHCLAGLVERPGCTAFVDLGGRTAAAVEQQQELFLLPKKEEELLSARPGGFGAGAWPSARSATASEQQQFLLPKKEEEPLSARPGGSAPGSARPSPPSPGRLTRLPPSPAPLARLRGWSPEPEERRPLLQEQDRPPLPRDRRLPWVGGDLPELGLAEQPRRRSPSPSPPAPAPPLPGQGDRLQKYTPLPKDRDWGCSSPQLFEDESPRSWWPRPGCGSEEQQKAVQTEQVRRRKLDSTLHIVEMPMGQDERACQCSLQ